MSKSPESTKPKYDPWQPELERGVQETLLDEESDLEAADGAADEAVVKAADENAADEDAADEDAGSLVAKRSGAKLEPEDEDTTRSRSSQNHGIDCTARSRSPIPRRTSTSAISNGVVQDSAAQETRPVIQVGRALQCALQNLEPVFAKLAASATATAPGGPNAATARPLQNEILCAPRPMAESRVPGAAGCAESRVPGAAESSWEADPVRAGQQQLLRQVGTKVEECYKHCLEAFGACDLAGQYASQALNSVTLAGNAACKAGALLKNIHLQ